MEQAFFEFLHNLEAAFNTTNPPGLIILFSLAIITDIGIPVPFVLDTILMLTAYKVMISGEPHWTPVVMIILMLFLGRQVGSGILYLLSRYLGSSFLGMLKKRFPSLENQLDTFKARLKHWATLMVVTGRLTPGLLQITSVASGAIRMRYQYFALGIALASIVYDGLLILLGFFAAHNPWAENRSFTTLLIIAMVVIVCILWPVLFAVIQRTKKKTETVKVEAK
jgi:membrane protein DedA with SNARE-associated domain